MTTVATLGSSFASRLNGQLARELAGESQFLACAVFYDGLIMPQTAGYFYAQARQQRRDALRMVRYLLQTATVEVPGVEAPVTTFVTVMDPIALAGDSARRSGEQLSELARIARDGSDFAAEQFMQWFVRANATTVASMSELLNVVKRNVDREGEIEQFVARERELLDEAPGAPLQAGVWSS